MKRLGFKQLKSKAGIFCYRKTETNTVVTVVYVDDTFFCGLDIKVLNDIKSQFMTQ